MPRLAFSAYDLIGGISMDFSDVLGKIEIIKAYVLKEFLVKNIDKLDIINALTMMHLKGDDFFHSNLEVKNGIASFFSIYEEITNLVELYDLNKSHKGQKKINKTILGIVSAYQRKLSRPVDIEDFGNYKPYLQLKNLLLLGEISMDKNGFVVFDDKNYKRIIEDVVNEHKREHKDKIDLMLNTLKNGNATP
jgi:hypothetical protein